MAIKDSVYVNVVTDADKAGKNMLKFAAAAAAAAAAIMAVYKIGKDLVEVYKVQEQAEAKLKAAIRATGKESEISFESMTALASSLQQVTTYGDEATISAMGMLQQLADLNQQGLEKVTPGVLDFAQAMNVDLQTAATLIGKTIGSDTNALARYGLVVDMSGTKTEKLASLTQALEDRFGGMAKAIAETATGAMAQFSNAFGDMKEEAGKAIAIGLKPFVQKLTDVITKTNIAKKSLNEIKEIIQKLGEGAEVPMADVLKVELDKYDKIAKDLELAEEKRSLKLFGWVGFLVKANQNWIDTLKGRLSVQSQIVLKTKELMDAEEHSQVAIAKGAKADLQALEDKAAMLDFVNDLQIDILTAAEEKRFAALAPLKQELYLLNQEYKELGEVRDAAKNAGLAKKEYQIVQDRINELYYNLIPNLKEEINLTDKLTEETKDLTAAEYDRLNVITKFREVELMLLEEYYEMQKKLGDKQIVEEEERIEKLKESAATALVDIGEALGAIIVSPAEGLQKMLEAFQSALSSVLLMFAKEWAVLAVGMLIPGPTFNPVAAAGYGVAAAGAAAGAGFINAFAEGGIINEPVFGVGQSGQRYLFGEKGPEEISPLNKGTSKPAFDIHGNTFVGAGGIREFVLELRKEFDSVDTLGL